MFVEAVGIAASGLPDWLSAATVLRGDTAYAACALAPYQPQMLSPNERRRVMPAVRQAFRVAEEAVAQTTHRAADLATVFASSEADLEILHRISSALSEPSRVVSPTDFHNSVHNAAAGYWTIAVGARRASVTLCAYDCGFSAALMEASTLLLDEEAVLAVVYDVPPPIPMLEKRPIAVAASVALVLARRRGPTALAQLELESPRPGARETVMEGRCLEELRQGNPALRALPLLSAIARRQRSTIYLESAGDTTTGIHVSPLS